MCRDREVETEFDIEHTLEEELPIQEDLETEMDVEFIEELPLEPTPFERHNIGRLDPARSGRVSPQDCQCDFPTLALAKGEVGPFHSQTLYCSECHYRFFTFCTFADADEPVGSDDDV